MNYKKIRKGERLVINYLLKQDEVDRKELQKYVAAVYGEDVLPSQYQTRAFLISLNRSFRSISGMIFTYFDTSKRTYSVSKEVREWCTAELWDSEKKEYRHPEYVRNMDEWNESLRGME